MRLMSDTARPNERKIYRYKLEIVAKLNKKDLIQLGQDSEQTKSKKQRP